MNYEDQSYVLYEWMYGVQCIIEKNLGYAPTKILLEGPPGASKTSFAEYLAHIYNAGYFEFNMHSGLFPENIFWEYSVRPGNQIEYTKSPLWEAFEASHTQTVVLVLDEIDKTRERVEELLLRALEKFRFRDPWGEEIVADERNMVVIATSNNKRKLMPPTLRRFPIRIKVGFPAARVQKQIIKSLLPPHLHIDPAIELAIKIANALRKIDPDLAPSYVELAALIYNASILFNEGYSLEEAEYLLSGTLWKGEKMPNLGYNWTKALKTEMKKKN